ncbi:unnamed protein product [Acanthosepion pharaonis]|uniref:Uncharacterized protein n=1 Tax=Acanthosepion pharaonis TaxID=158019 RepID=A0A812ET22_ACAPH|nr:unnamed protein product [Sepia pharaonis]
MPSLVRTPDRHNSAHNRTPDLKPASRPCLQVTGLQEDATTPSDETVSFNSRQKKKPAKKVIGRSSIILNGESHANYSRARSHYGLTRGLLSAAFPPSTGPALISQPDQLKLLQLTILMPSLVRTPDRHNSAHNRTPDLKPASRPCLQVTGLQEDATTPSDETVSFNSRQKKKPAKKVIGRSSIILNGESHANYSRARSHYGLTRGLLSAAFPPSTGPALISQPDQLKLLQLTILMPSLVRTPDRHNSAHNRTPDLKPATRPCLQVTGLQEDATTPSDETVSFK